MPTVAGLRVLRLGARAARSLLADSYRLGVSAITAGVATFLLVRLHAWPPHEDETLALFISRRPLGDLFKTVLAERGGAPLHFLLSHLVGLASPGLTGLRLLSVAFAVASVPVLAALVARLTDQRTALVATLVAAPSWVMLFHGIYGRMYSLFLFTSALSFLALLRALAAGRPRGWAAWGLAMLATLASQPYGAAVLAVQAVYVLARRARRRFPLRWPLAAFVGVTILALPLWRSDLVLASRFDVGVGGGGTRLGSPFAVLVYIRSVLGDFTAGWDAAFAFVVAAALLGLGTLARRRSLAALLAGVVFAVPVVALSLARLSTMTYPETRHLIFALPFFGMLVAAGLLRLARAARGAGPAVLGLTLAALVSAELAWGWQRTPTLYTGEPAARVEAREHAAAWLAATSRSDDVLFGYDPLFLGAREAGGRLGEVIVPRADPRLALRALREAAKPLGRGVWVHDASDTNNPIRRLEIERRSPGPEFEAKVFGPFLILRTKQPTVSADSFLRDTERVQRLGRELSIGDADINYRTAVAALGELEGRR